MALAEQFKIALQIKRDIDGPLGALVAEDDDVLGHGGVLDSTRLHDGLKCGEIRVEQDQAGVLTSPATQQLCWAWVSRTTTATSGLRSRLR